MSIVNSTLTNRFTYTKDSGGVYGVQHNILDILKGQSYISNHRIGKLIMNYKSTILNDSGSNTNIKIPANTATEIININNTVLIDNIAYQLLSLHIPVKIDDFTQITSKDTMTITIVTDNNAWNFSIPLEKSPITVLNYEYVPDKVSMTFKVNVRIPYDGEYIITPISHFLPSPPLDLNNTLFEIVSEF